MIKDIEGREVEPGDICIAKGYNGMTKVKIYKETAKTIQLSYWSDHYNNWDSKTYVYKDGSFAQFYKIGHER